MCSLSTQLRLLALLVALVHVSALGAPKARLSYSLGRGATECPQESALRDAVAARLGYEPFDEAAPRQLHVEVIATSVGLRARVELRGSGGELLGVRQLQSAEADCRELTSSLALAIGLALDPLRRAKTEEPHAPPVEVAPSAPVDEESRHPPTPLLSTAQAQPVRGPELLAGVGLAGSLGTAPGASFGVSVEGALQWRRRFSLGLGLKVDVSPSVELSRGRARTNVWAVSLAPCVHERWVSGCVVVLGGATVSTAESISRPRTTATPYGSVGPRLAVDVPLSGVLSLRAHAELLVRVLGVALFVDETEAWTSPLLAGGGGLSLVMRF